MECGGAPAGTDEGRNDEMKSYRPVLRCLALVALGFNSAAAVANTGTVTQLSGTLSVVKADGSVRILSQKSEVIGGDTVNTQKDSYAQIKFSDGGTITLKPNSSVKISGI